LRNYPKLFLPKMRTPKTYTPFANQTKADAPDRAVIPSERQLLIAAAAIHAEDNATFFV
jgi:hypothetical protein